ncbi:hypothetical protein GRJ2_001905400 [Grus japonensis]|uniref:Uncharacterized protein n=1 Tax=Grus japonensis TaxID=30415 RepID=A0ABC9X9X6_GRUJA
MRQDPERFVERRLQPGCREAQGPTVASVCGAARRAPRAAGDPALLPGSSRCLELVVTVGRLVRPSRRRAPRQRCSTLQLQPSSCRDSATFRFASSDLAVAGIFAGQAFGCPACRARGH